MPTVAKDPAKTPLSSPTVLPTASTDERDLDAVIELALQRHPSFRICTVCGRFWIDPYTGARVPIATGHRLTARTYLLARRPWTRATLNSAADLEVFRWRLYLGEQLSGERRLRLFAHDGRWQNPFSGVLTTLVATSGITEAVLQEMASILARCPYARSGRLLDRLRLEAALASQRLVAPTASGDPPTRATTRITGPRAAGGSGNRDASASGLDGEQVRVKTSLEGMLSPLPDIPGYGFSLHYEPVSGVGGDFYDCSRIDEHRWFIALGDVSGHGVQGARVAVSTLSALRGILPRQSDLVGIVSALNDEVRRDLPRGHFVTLFAGILDTRADQLSCVCAGHHPALLASRNRARVLERVGNRGPALGLLGPGSLAASLRPTTTALAQGDTLFLYTDGLTEAKNDLHSEYGLNRLMGSLIANLEAPYDRLVGQVVEDTRRFASGVIDDDLSVLALSLEQPA
jgi:serine phosphatase RsbU (regulator of sigma subunit)